MHDFNIYSYVIVCLARMYITKRKGICYLHQSTWEYDSRRIVTEFYKCRLHIDIKMNS